MLLAFLTFRMRASAGTFSGQDTDRTKRPCRTISRISSSRSCGTFPATGHCNEETRSLSRLGIRCLCLLTNNLRKVAGLERYGITVAERVPHVIPPTPESSRYLKTKKKRLGHLL